MPSLEQCEKGVDSAESADKSTTAGGNDNNNNNKEKNTEPSTLTASTPSSSRDKRPSPPSNDDGNNEQSKRHKQTSTTTPLPNNNTNTNNDNNSSDVSSRKKKPAYDLISSKLKSSKAQSIGDEKEGVRPRTKANEPISLDDDEEEEDLYEEEKWYICPPAASKASANWKFFHVFDLNKHPKMIGNAMCLICYRNKQYTKGTVKCTGGSTSGLKRHMTSNHNKEYEDAIQNNATSRGQSKKQYL